MPDGADARALAGEQALRVRGGFPNPRPLPHTLRGIAPGVK